MSKAKDVFKEHPTIRFFVMLLGLTISSIGINGFIRPAHLLSGGAAGVAIAINYLTGLNVGILTFIINIPIFILGLIFLDREFCALSFVNMLLFSFLLGVTNNLSAFIQVDDIMLQCIFGGILNGIGMGLVFKTRASMGGTDIICAILKIKKNIAIKDTSLFINFLIVFAGMFLFGVTPALYTLIEFFVSAITLNHVKDMLNSQKNMFILSLRHEEIADDILHVMHRGVTYLYAEGAYTNKRMNMLYVVISSNEIPKLMEIVNKHDKKAFVSVNDVLEVRGRGFKPKEL